VQYAFRFRSVSTSPILCAATGASRTTRCRPHSASSASRACSGRPTPRAATYAAQAPRRSRRLTRAAAMAASAAPSADGTRLTVLCASLAGTRGQSTTPPYFFFSGRARCCSSPLRPIILHAFDGVGSMADTSRARVPARRRNQHAHAHVVRSGGQRSYVPSSNSGPLSSTALASTLHAQPIHDALKRLGLLASAAAVDILSAAHQRHQLVSAFPHPWRYSITPRCSVRVLCPVIAGVRVRGLSLHVLLSSSYAWCVFMCMPALSRHVYRATVPIYLLCYRISYFCGQLSQLTSIERRAHIHYRRTRKTCGNSHVEAPCMTASTRRSGTAAKERWVGRKLEGRSCASLNDLRSASVSARRRFAYVESASILSSTRLWHSLHTLE
jgi:hypothetical protein